jgi:hypothetical protein
MQFLYVRHRFTAPKPHFFVTNQTSQNRGQINRNSYRTSQRYILYLFIYCINFAIEPTMANDDDDSAIIVSALLLFFSQAILLWSYRETRAPSVFTQRMIWDRIVAHCSSNIFVCCQRAFKSCSRISDETLKSMKEWRSYGGGGLSCQKFDSIAL